MRAEEFWKDDPQLFVAYRTSFINNKNREMEELDYKCWLQGLYIHYGNGKLFSSLKQFIGNLVASMCNGKKDNRQIDTYPMKTYSQLAKEKKQEEIEKRKKENYQEYQKAMIYFGTIKQRFLENLKKKGE